MSLRFSPTVLAVAYFSSFLGLVGCVAYFDIVRTGGASLDGAVAVLALGVGVVAGCMLAAWLTLDKVELGLVPLGAIGMAVVSFAQAGRWFGWDPWWTESSASSPVGLLLLGLSGGFFVLPQLGTLRLREPVRRAGELWAAVILSLVLTSAVVYGAVGWVRTGAISASSVYWWLGMATIGVTAYCCWLLPEYLFRLLFWLATHTLYRVRVIGRENLPDRGPALLVCNHLSYADGFFVVATTHRLVRFLIWGGIANSPYLRWLARIMGVIPISSVDGPKQLARSLRAARDALRRGELVCVFAEGQISRTGKMLKFKRGFERVVQGVEAPIVPTCLDCVWGSVFSYQGGAFFWKWPKRLPYPVTVSFGKPMASTSDAFRVRQAVQELAAEAVSARKHEQRPMHVAFVREAVRRPRRFCMADSRGTELSFGMTVARLIALSRVLSRRLAPDEKMVGVLLPPSVGGSIFNLALLAAGRVPINLNYTASSEVIGSCIRQCDIRTVFSTPELLKRVKITLPFEATPAESLREHVSWRDKLAGMLGGFVLPGALTQRWLLHAGSIDDLATVIFSSGSTGEPKGVMLTHHNVMSNCEAVVQVIDPTMHDRIIGLLPLFHSFGFLANLSVPFMVGAGAVYHNNPLDVKEIGELTAKYGGTILLATPTFLRAYTRKIPPEQLKTLRLVITGAEKLPKEVAEAYHEKFGVMPMEGYGCTELSPVVSVNTPDFVVADGRQVGNKPGTVGHPLPGVVAKVVNPDTGEELLPGSDGLLLVKGPNVMQGYLGKPELTREAIRDGWYVTGDIAHLDEDGFITITDRLSRFSKIGGEMVPHVRVEEAIRQALETDAQGGVVAGVPDPSRGERLVVLHEPLPVSVDELWQKLNSSGLPRLWVPSRDSFYEVSEIPYLGTGKLDLKRIKEMARDLAGA